VQTRLRREYPEQLQDQGIGGRVVLWFLVDENGYVRRYLMKESSGQPGLDRAAMKVARLARFRPAVNYDRHVAVWVALPVLFRTVEPAG
jgi:TonB family protein